MRKLSCSVLLALIFSGQILAQNCSPGQAVFRDTLCCGEYKGHYACQGSSGKCDPINTWSQCAQGCAIGNAGCGIGNAEPSALSKTSSPIFVGVSQPAHRFSESSCGQKVLTPGWMENWR